MAAFLNRRRFIFGCCGTAVFGGAQLLHRDMTANHATRVAEHKAENAAVQEAVKARQLRSVSAHKTVTGVAFAGNRHLFSSGGDWLNPNEPSLRLWQAETGKDVLTYAGHAGGVAGLSVTKDGLHALSAGRQDSNVKYWDIARPQEIKTFTLTTEYKSKAYLSAVAFSPNEQSFAVAGLSLLRLYDLKSGARIWDYKDVSQNEEIRNIAFSPDGSFLLATGLRTHWIATASGQRIRSYQHPYASGATSFPRGAIG